MGTMGLPKVKITFESMGLSAIQRSERGTVLLLIKGTNDNEQGSYKFNSLIDLPEEVAFSEDVAKYIRLAFEAGPRKMLVEVYGDKHPLNDVLGKLKLVKFNYYATPNASEEDIKTIQSWHENEVKAKDRTIKFVGFEYGANNETVINWAVPRVVYDGITYTGQEFTALVASQLAALPLDRSFTFFTWPLLTDADLPFADNEDEAVNQGKLFLTFDGDNYKIARGVNSFTEYTANKGEDFSKIKIIEAMHLIKDDIRDTWNNHYVGKILNTYANKQQFIALINRVYFAELKNVILENTDRNKVDIDLEACYRYAVKRGAKVEDMTDQQIKEFNTGANVFLNGRISILDAMEDLYINFFNE